MPSTKKHFDFDLIGSRPDYSKADIPIWCDYLEVLCMMTPDGYISRGEVIDIVFRDGKDFFADEPEEVEESDEDFDFDDLSEFGVDDDDDDPATLGLQLTAVGSGKGRADDRIDRIVADWFVHLATRDRLFGTLYPFVANEQDQTLALKPATDLTLQHKLYICLLLAGNLRLLSKQLLSRLTADFEFLCLDAQTLLFPLSLNGGASGRTYLFGKNPQAGGIFTGSLKQKFTELATMIQAHAADLSGIKPNDSGDRGIDIVSVLSFENDLAFGMPLVLAQCACSYTAWKKKQDDHAPSKYKQMNLFDVDYLRVMFIPFFFRDCNGKWFEPIDVSTILIDRLRLMRVLFQQQNVISLRALPWAELLLTKDESDRQHIAEWIIEGTAA